ncbi:hypothetical protein [Primorskyibacter sp. S87]|uniref:hypothetical protein n=1 Tax=Primorskyibacter sp. S87 TaxID=3415126 RepID=UPI003C7EC601
MMKWTDLTQDWASSFPRVKSRFPHLDDSSMPFLKLDRNRFEAHLAETHQLTVTEAREEFEDFLFVESLSREMDD